MLSSMTCPAVQYSSTLSHKPQDFQKKKIDHKMCVLVFSTKFVWYISHSTKNWAGKVKNVYRYSCKVPVILVRFNETWFSWQIFEKYWKFKLNEKSYSGSRVVHAEKRTDMTKFIIAFRNLRTRLKKVDVNLPPRISPGLKWSSVPTSSMRFCPFAHVHTRSINSLP
jgi:hypothetical protein